MNPFSDSIPVGRLLIRADASVAIGTGHVMRMIALAQAWQRRGGTVTLAARECAESLANRLNCENISLHRLPEFQRGSLDDARAMRQLASELAVHALVVDGYEFGGDYQLQIRSTCRPLLVVDDYGHTDQYHCDIILNQNPGAVPELYGFREAGTKLFIGPRFAMLRNEFLVSNETRSEAGAPAEQALRLLVTLGGSDEANITGLVLNAIATIRDIPLSVRVLVGSCNPHASQLLEQAQSMPNVSIWQNVTDMASQYTDADFAIAAGGTTNWEMCLFGLPRMLVVLADNQRAVAAALHNAGAVHNLGSATDLTKESLAASIMRLVNEKQTRQRLAKQSRVLVDGWGAARVVDELLATGRCAEYPAIGDGSLSLRPARLSDSSLLLGWRNDWQTRQFSRQQELVSPANHERWLVATIEGTGRRLFIAESSGKAIGTVRLDLGETVEISWTIAPSARGMGLGKQLVQLVVDQSDCDLIACVRPENEASKKIALAAGFEISYGTNELLTYRRPCRKKVSS